jgi:hypothetical protein
MEVNGYTIEPGADLAMANLAGANLHRANLARALLEGANLHRANLRGANLYWANLHRAYLHGADLARALLEGANLHGALLEGANLRGANLHGAKGIIEVGGPDWSLYLIQRDGKPPFIKGGICRWFETRKEATTHWRAYDNAHGRLMLAKLSAAWAIAKQQGWL